MQKSICILISTERTTVWRRHYNGNEIAAIGVLNHSQLEVVVQAGAKGDRVLMLVLVLVLTAAVPT